MENGEWKMNEQKLLRKDGWGDSDTEIASGGVSLKGSRNDGIFRNGKWKMNEQKLLRNDGMRDSDTEIASRGVSLKVPRNDGIGGVARRLLRGEVH